MKTYIGIYKVVAASLAFSLPLSHVIGAGDGSHYSENRLQELDVIYRSALQEIEWVLENYPFPAEIRKESKENTEEPTAVTNGTIQQVLQEVDRKAAIYEEVLKDAEEKHQEKHQEKQLKAITEQRNRARQEQKQDTRKIADQGTAATEGQIPTTTTTVMGTPEELIQETKEQAGVEQIDRQVEEEEVVIDAEAIGKAKEDLETVRMHNQAARNVAEKNQDTAPETQQATKKAEEDKAAYLKALEAAEAKVKEAKAENNAARSNIFNTWSLEQATTRHSVAINRLSQVYEELWDLQNKGLHKGWLPSKI
jgi:hypothetical protein